MLLPKVSIRDLDDATKIFGPAQKAVAMAVVDSVEEGIIPKEMVEDICILCGVFIHPQAQDADKIYEYNYQATRISIKRAFASEPDINEIIEKKNLEGHPFYK